MKQKISFNLNIFTETMRQLRVTGILSVIIMAGLTILSIVGNCSEADEYIYQSTVNGLESMPWLIITYILLVPLLMFQAFHFMDKRNSSDFYHSLPHTRSTIYISVSAAVMTWVIISMLSTIIPALLGTLIFAKHITILYGAFFSYVIFCISACFVVGGAILIAKSLTGTIFNSIILTGIILLVPRLLITLFVASIEANPMFDGFIGNAFTSNSLNPVVGSIFYFIEIDYSISFSSLVTSASTIIYGFVLGIIYFVLGGIAFCRRSSETASKSAPSRRLQAVYRLIIIVTLSSFVIAALFNEIHVLKVRDYSVIGIIASYLAIILVYFLYELISTKKLKNLVRAIPGLGIAAVLNISMYFGLTACYNNEMNFRPEPDEINSITVIPDIRNNYGSVNYFDYVVQKMDGVEISDVNVIEDISESLKKNASLCESGTNKLYSYQNNSQNNIMSIPLKINTNGVSKSRKLMITSDQYAALNEALCENKDFQKAWMSPPSFKEISNVYVSNYFSGDDFSMNVEYEDIYYMFLEEIEKCDFKTWFNDFVEDNIDIGFHCEYVIDGESYNLTIPLSENVAPNTVKRCNEIAKEKQENEIAQINKYINDLKKDGTTFDGEVYVNIFSKDSIVYSSYYELSNSTEAATELINSCTGDMDKISSFEDYIEIQINFYNVTTEDRDYYDGNSFRFVFPTDEDTVNKIKALSEKYNGVVEEDIHYK